MEGRDNGVAVKRGVVWSGGVRGACLFLLTGRGCVAEESVEWGQIAGVCVLVCCAGRQEHQGQGYG